MTSSSRTPPSESPMGTPANGFRKPRHDAAPKHKPMTIREAVTKYGDSWRLMMPGFHFIKAEHMEQETSDSWDALHMREMERGEKSRIDAGDIINGD